MSAIAKAPLLTGSQLRNAHVKGQRPRRNLPNRGLVHRAYAPLVHNTPPTKGQVTLTVEERAQTISYFTGRAILGGGS